MSSVCGFGDSDYFSQYGSGRGGYSSDLDDSVGESPVSQQRTVSVSSDEGFASLGQSYNWSWSNGDNTDEQQLPVGQGASWDELVVFRTAQSLAKLRVLESEPEPVTPKREKKPSGNMFNAFLQQVSL
uniref:Uncharacterized protein n=1 Tax=Plectus sambesii TaxID=2011161 RepID=A0A914UKL5_9BILA